MQNVIFRVKKYIYWQKLPSIRIPMEIFDTSNILIYELDELYCLINSEKLVFLFKLNDIS